MGLFLFVAFRYKVGCDWTGYLIIFESAHHEKPQSEIAFWELNRLLHYFELDYPYINVIAALGFFAGLHALAKRQPDPLGALILAFPILILELAMSGIRQAIAVGLLCFGYNAFVDKHLVRFVIFVLMATSFHSSAIIFLLLAPFVHGELSIRPAALGGLLALPGAYFLLTSATFELYSQRYVGSGMEAAGAPFRSGLLAITGIGFLWFLAPRWKVHSTKDYKIVKMSSYMMIATFPLSMYSSVMGDRIGLYLYPIQLMILTRLGILIAGQYSTVIAFAPYATGIVFLVIYTQLSTLFVRCYIPYQMWW